MLRIDCKISSELMMARTARQRCYWTSIVHRFMPRLYPLPLTLHCISSLSNSVNWVDLIACMFNRKCKMRWGSTAAHPCDCGARSPSQQLISQDLVRPGFVPGARGIESFFEQKMEDANVFECRPSMWLRSTQSKATIGFGRSTMTFGFFAGSKGDRIVSKIHYVMFYNSFSECLLLSFIDCVVFVFPVCEINVPIPK